MSEINHSLVVVRGPDAGRIFPLQGDRIGVGRDPGIGICLADPTVSRRHAELIRLRGGYELRDLGSANGTRVGAERVQRAALRDGDLVQVGDSVLRYVEGWLASAARLEFQPTATLTMTEARRQFLDGTAGLADDRETLLRLRRVLIGAQRVGQAIHALPTTKELVPGLPDLLLQELSGTDRAALYLGGEEAGGWACAAARGREAGGGAASDPASRAILDYAARQGVAVWIKDVETDGRFSARESVRRQHIQACLVAPLWQGGECRGLLYADALARADAFTEDDLRWMALVSLQAAAALDRARLYDRLADEKDALQRALAELKAAQQRLVQSAKMAAMGQLVAGFIHDIRNPMMVVQGHAHILQKLLGGEVPAGHASECMTTCLDNIARGVAQCNGILNQLLQFARQAPPDLETCSLNQVVSETLDFTRAELGGRGIKVARELQPDLPAVWANVNQIKQVFLNLVLNAAQAMEPGGRLTVRTAAQSGSEGNSVCVEFEDTGCGMTEEDLGCIFDPFYTTKPSSGGPGGTGLGLSVSYSIVQNHGGILEARSRPGAGSVFTVRLPRRDAPAPDKEQTQVLREGPPPGQLRG